MGTALCTALLNYGEVRVPGRLVALDLNGNIVEELPEPKGFGSWSPTSVALVNPSDPDSDIWVADGYGQSLVHLYTADGTLTRTPDGSGLGARSTARIGILVRTAGAEKVLYVADRRTSGSSFSPSTGRICVPARVSSTARRA